MENRTEPNEDDLDGVLRRIERELRAARLGSRYAEVGADPGLVEHLAAGGSLQVQQPMHATKGQGLRGGLVYVQLSVVNPNDFPLEATGLTYNLELRDPTTGGDGEWVDLAEGRFGESVRVGARDSSIVEIPVEFTYTGAGAALRSILDRGTLSYRVADGGVGACFRLELPLKT